MVDVYFRHLFYRDGVGQDGLSLTVLVARSINFELWRFGPLLVIVLEEAYKELGSDYEENEIRLVRIKFISEMAN